MDDREEIEVKDRGTVSNPECIDKNVADGWQTRLMTEVFRGVQDSVQRLEQQSQKALHQAQQEADSIKQSAKEDADKIREEAELLARKRQEEAEHALKQLQENADGEIRRLQKEAEQRAMQIQEEAEWSAEKIRQDAQIEAEKIRQESQQIRMEAEQRQSNTEQTVKDILEEGRRELDSLEQILKKQLQEVTDIRSRYESAVEKLRRVETVISDEESVADAESENAQASMQEMQEEQIATEEEPESEELAEESQEVLKAVKKKKRRRIFLLCFVFIAAPVILFQTVLGVALVKDDSMTPSLKKGYLVFYNRLENNLDSGDVLVLNNDDSTVSMKRVVGVSGDVISHDEQTGEILVNDKAVMDDVDGEIHTGKELVSFPFTVEEHTYFVLSDNRNDRTVSEEGVVQQNAVKGKVIQVLKV